MLDDTITLAVDTANTGSTTNVDCIRDEEYLNRTIYTLPSNNLASRDILGFYRTKPTKSGNFLGVAKSTVKFTKDIEVDGADGVATYKQPMIFELSVSLPVGATAAEAMEMRQRMVALLDDDSIMVDHQEELQI